MKTEQTAEQSLKIQSPINLRKITHCQMHFLKKNDSYQHTHRLNSKFIRTSFITKNENQQQIKSPEKSLKTAEITTHSTIMLRILQNKNLKSKIRVSSNSKILMQTNSKMEEALIVHTDFTIRYWYTDFPIRYPSNH